MQDWPTVVSLFAAVAKLHVAISNGVISKLTFKDLSLEYFQIFHFPPELELVLTWR